MFFKRVTAPTSSLLTLDEAKSYLELGDDDSEDANIGLAERDGRLPTWRTSCVSLCSIRPGASGTTGPTSHAAPSRTAPR